VELIFAEMNLQWEKPEELTSFEQQKQLLNQSVQQSQIQGQPSIPPTQQVAQNQQVQPQSHFRGQVHHQQIQQPSSVSISMIYFIWHRKTRIMLMTLLSNSSSRHMELQVIKMFR